jgi:hypothetical protein
VSPSQLHSQPNLTVRISDLAVSDMFALPFSAPLGSRGCGACRSLHCCCVGRYGARGGPILTYSRRRGVTAQASDAVSECFFKTCVLYVLCRVLVTLRDVRRSGGAVSGLSSAAASSY